METTTGYLVEDIFHTNLLLLWKYTPQAFLDCLYFSIKYFNIWAIGFLKLAKFFHKNLVLKIFGAQFLALIGPDECNFVGQTLF